MKDPKTHSFYELTIDHNQLRAAGISCKIDDNSNLIFDIECVNNLMVSRAMNALLRHLALNDLEESVMCESVTKAYMGIILQRALVPSNIVHIEEASNV